MALMGFCCSGLFFLRLRSPNSGRSRRVGHQFDSPFEVLEKSFALLVTGPEPLSLDGRAGGRRAAGTPPGGGAAGQGDAGQSPGSGGGDARGAGGDDPYRAGQGGPAGGAAGMAVGACRPSVRGEGASLARVGDPAREPGTPAAGATAPGPDPGGSGRGGRGDAAGGGAGGGEPGRRGAAARTGTPLGCPLRRLAQAPVPRRASPGRMAADQASRRYCICCNIPPGTESRNAAGNGIGHDASASGQGPRRQSLTWPPAICVRSAATMLRLVRVPPAPVSGATWLSLTAGWLRGRAFWPICGALRACCRAADLVLVAYCAAGCGPLLAGQAGGDVHCGGNGGLRLSTPRA